MEVGTVELDKRGEKKEAKATGNEDVGGERLGEKKKGKEEWSRCPQTGLISCFIRSAVWENTFGAGSHTCPDYVCQKLLFPALRGELQ